MGCSPSVKRTMVLGRGMSAVDTSIHESSLDQKVPIFSCVGRASTSTASPAAAILTSLLPQLIDSKFRSRSRGLRRAIVMVSDLSGMTRSTREFGILHTASIIMRMRQLVVPVLLENGAIDIETEADDLLVVFPDAESTGMWLANGAARALPPAPPDAYPRSIANPGRAVVGMKSAIDDYNRELEKRGRDSFRIQLSGIGLGAGRNLIKDKWGHFHGQAARTAFLFGEEISEKGKLICSELALQWLRTTALFKGVEFTQNEVESDVSYFSCDIPMAGARTQEAKKGDRKERAAAVLHRELQRLCERSSLSDGELKKFDKSFLDKYQVKSTCVLMFDYDWSQRKRTLAEILTTKVTVQAMAESAAKDYRGVVLEDRLFSFKSPQDATLCAIRIRQQVEKHNGGLPEGSSDMWPVTGFGLHSGPMLLIPDTDVHWGDCVNSASKLGQDLANNCDIILSRKIRDELVQEAGRSSVPPLVLGGVLTKSKVNFEVYFVGEVRGDYPGLQAPSST